MWPIEILIRSIRLNGALANPAPRSVLDDIVEALHDTDNNESDVSTEEQPGSARLFLHPD